MKQDRLLLFDFDGVIADSFEAAYETAQKLIPGLTVDGYREMFLGNVYTALEEIGAPNTHPRIDDEFFQHYVPKFANLSPFSGIPEALSELSKQFTSVIISSCLSPLIEQFLNKHNLAHCFHSVHGADVHRSKVEKIKNIVRDHQAEPSHCLFITDTVGDIREARQAGVPTLAVGWGFHSPDDLLAENPLTLVTTPAALVEEVRRLLS